MINLAFHSLSLMPGWLTAIDGEENTYLIKFLKIGDRSEMLIATNQKLSGLDAPILVNQKYVGENLTRYDRWSKAENWFQILTLGTIFVLLASGNFANQHLVLLIAITVGFFLSKVFCNWRKVRIPVEEFKVAKALGGPATYFYKADLYSMRFLGELNAQRDINVI